MLDMTIRDIFEYVKGWCYAITHLREKEPKISCWQPINHWSTTYNSKYSSSSASSSTPSRSYFDKHYPYSYHCDECNAITYSKISINKCSLCSKIEEDFLSEEDMIIN